MVTPYRTSALSTAATDGFPYIPVIDGSAWRDADLVHGPRTDSMGQRQCVVQLFEPPEKLVKAWKQGSDGRQVPAIVVFFESIARYLMQPLQAGAVVFHRPTNIPATVVRFVGDGTNETDAVKVKIADPANTGKRIQMNYLRRELETLDERNRRIDEQAEKNWASR
jgi:hypothetical protein